MQNVAHGRGASHCALYAVLAEVLEGMTFALLLVTVGLIVATATQT